MTRAKKVCPFSLALTGRSVSRVNMFVKACAEVVIEAINAGILVAVCHATSSYMWSLDIYRCLLNLVPAFDDGRPSGAGTWTSKVLSTC